MLMPSKEKMNKYIMAYFHDQNEEASEYTMINSIALATCHLIVICRNKLAPYLSEIKNEVIPLGAGDFLSNKASVCISFKLGMKRMLFINCHLQAHAHNLVKRNEQWINISNKFVHKNFT